MTAHTKPPAAADPHYPNFLHYGQVRVTIPKVPLYEILNPDKIHLTIDRSLVLSNATLVRMEAFTVMPTAGTAILGGPGFENISEAELAINRTIPRLVLTVTLCALHAPPKTTLPPALSPPKTILPPRPLARECAHSFSPWCAAPPRPISSLAGTRTRGWRRWGATPPSTARSSPG